MMSTNIMSGVIIFYFIYYISAQPIQTKTALSTHDPDAQPSPSSIPDSQKQLIKYEPYNDNIAKILKTLIENAINSIGEKLIPLFGNFFRSKPKTIPFAGIAENVARTVVSYLADAVASQVYDMTKSVRPHKIKHEGALKMVIIRVIDSARDPLKECITQAINKKAEELKEKSGKWSEILADVSKAKIAHLPGIDEELSKDISEVIESAVEDLTNKAYQKLRSPEKDQIVGRFVDHAYNGAAALVRASGEKVKTNAWAAKHPLDMRIGLQIIADLYEETKTKNISAGF